VKTQALAAAKDWSELEKFSKNRKSPIGYEPFVDACMKFDSNTTEAEKYIIKVPVEKRVRLYVKIGQLEQAIESAFQMRSLDDLNHAAIKCAGNRPLLEKINVYRAQLTQKR